MRGRFLVITALMLGAPFAHAHDADVIFVTIKEDERSGALYESVNLTLASLAQLVPLPSDSEDVLSQKGLEARGEAVRAGFWNQVPLAAGDQPCMLLNTSAWLREGHVELKGEFRCPQGDLRQDFRILRVLPANYKVVMRSQRGGETSEPFSAQGSLTTIRVPRSPPAGAWDGTKFQGAFRAAMGGSRSFEVIGILVSLLVAMGTWRRALGASGLAIGAACLGSWLSLNGWGTTLLLLLVGVGAAVWPRPPPFILALMLGAAAGLREGGGTWSTCLGVAAGVGLVLALGTGVAIGTGMALQGRPGLLRVIRWGAVLLAFMAVLRRALLPW